MAQNRKGYYRAGHYVKPSSASTQRKKPSAGIVLVVGLVVLAGWNTLFGNDSDNSENTPQPHPPGTSAPTVSGQ
ncbi:hypothetical protein ABT282_36255 [Streptomyces sp. NPDC000927]|uniref:hypothetical protein n=1 Tax=Streptomyces sp. NPDC000927 TaxID=3154371 RepID=UPI0033214361